MNKITSLNFEELYPKIKEEITNSSFLAFDCEFTGLNDSDTESLFDTPTERYKKIRNNVKNFLIVQYGLAIFKYNRESNAFESSQYSFYLLPDDVPGADEPFRCEASALRFLCRAGLDWQALFHHGLGFISRAQEATLRQKLQRDKLASDIYEQMSFEDKKRLQDLCSKVSAWAGKEKLVESEDDELVLECDTTDPSILYYASRQVRWRFPDLWAERCGPGQLVVTKLTEGRRQELKLRDMPEIALETYFRGFSKVFAALCAARKPLVGHNCLKDLAMAFQQFVGPLPASYTSFKSDLHGIFPAVYDTKHLAYALRTHMPSAAEYEVASLQELYQYLREGRGSELPVFAPSVGPAPDGAFHDAGYDAYCTAFCFIKLAYFFRELVQRLVAVTEEEVLSAGRQYVAPLFRPDRARTSLVCHPTKADEISQGFSKLGFEVAVSKSLNETFLRGQAAS